MHPSDEYSNCTRRDFLTTAASGLGAAALTSLLANDGLLAASSGIASRPVGPHFAPRAKACIFLFMAGGPSQMEMFDPKPLLTKRHGEKLPDSFTKDAEFAFIDKEQAVLKGTDVTFGKYGEAGTEYSSLVPHIAQCADDIALIRTMHGEQFNHHPGQLLLSTGKAEFGRPTIGSWLLYGLGSESRNLPGYVVLLAGRGASGSTSNWSSGFLPTTYQGVPFRNRGEPVLHLANPKGVDADHQRRTVETIARLNRERFGEMHDPKIASRIVQYELAFRMQSAAPELIDLSGESRATLDAYGVDRSTPLPTADLQAAETYSTFSSNCLLARRLVERGVRFVNIVHASWDQHGDLKHDLAWNARMADQPVAALLKDLKQRGLLDETLVVWGSEFGRTPLGQGEDGRDHHPFAFSMWMAGGGVKGGQVYGASDEFGWGVAENPVHVNDFQATLLHLFGFNHEKLSVNFKGLDVRLTNLAGTVVHELIA
ncbi:MAG: DUF1501 domain-containing protein [Planctomycetales bacterium]